jgi:hypothetical protein
MKSLRFLPLTFLAGVHGFAIFAPYAALAVATLLVANRRRRQRVLALAPVLVRAPDPGV